MVRCHSITCYKSNKIDRNDLGSSSEDTDYCKVRIFEVKYLNNKLVISKCFKEVF